MRGALSGIAIRPPLLLARGPMIGSTVSRYRIVAKLGGGGMGVVYEAEDTELGRRVAIKFLPEEALANADALERFKREARAASALDHSHICTVHDVGEHDGRPYLVMERLKGRTLKHAIGREGLPVEQVISLGEQIADALDAAHGAGIIHRDVKPANLFVTERGEAKVLDFGLAKVSTAPSGSAIDAAAPTVARELLTEVGTTLGTTAYMSPEQTRGQVVDARSDIFSLGVTLYEAATGRLPFQGETAADLLAAVLRHDPPPPSRWNPKIPPKLDEILLKALEKDPTLRYQTAADLRGDLLRLKRDASAASASGARALARAEETARRGRLLRIGIAAAALVAIAVIGYVATRSRPFVAGTVREGGTSSSTPQASGAAPHRSIAVLPFVNGSGNPDDDYLADGITDELIAGLGKIPNLHVAARTSVFSFKGQTIEVREIARRLGVETVLEGTVRRSGSRLRVTASLASAADGLQLWSATFQNDGGDTFAVQDDVTQGVVSGLALQMGGAALAASQAGRTTSPEAQDLYLRGLSYFRSGTEPDLRRALELYQQALARDREFALAYAGIGWVYTFLADAYMAPIEAYPKARAAALAAIERDELVADAHAVLGYALSDFEWNPPAAEREFRRAIELDPNSALVRFLYGFDRCLAGRNDEGLALLDRAQQLDPLSVIPSFSREVCFYLAHRFDDVLVAHRKSVELDPKFWYLESFVGAAYREMGDYEAALREYAEAEANSGGLPQYGMALTYARMGKEEEARAILRRLDQSAEGRYVPYWTRAAAYAGIGDLDRAVALLQKAFDTRESWMPAGRRLPELAALASKDPRARRILDDVEAVQRGNRVYRLDG